MPAPQVLADVAGELLSQPPGGDAFEGAGEAGQGDLGRVVHGQVDVTGFAVELAEFRAGVRAQVPGDFLAAGRDLPGERAAPYFGVKTKWARRLVTTVLPLWISVFRSPRGVM
jgi:hypothetical protein